MGMDMDTDMDMFIDTDIGTDMGTDMGTDLDMDVDPFIEKDMNYHFYFIMNCCFKNKAKQPKQRCCHPTSTTRN
jgi:hypothetical protein